MDKRSETVSETLADTITGIRVKIDDRFGLK
jgi:hypothetical protein